jgi:hypothetical protein
MTEEDAETAFLAGAQSCEDWHNDLTLGLALLWDNSGDAWLWWKSIHKEQEGLDGLRKAFEAGWESYENSLELDAP